MNMNRLEQMRLDALLTPEQVADRTGVSAKTIRRAESGTKPRLSTLRPLAEFFEVQPSELLAPAVFEQDAA